MKKIIKNSKGMALSAVLFILMAILISTFLLIRSNDISLLVAGNVGHRTEVAHGNEKAVSEALNWLNANSGSLDSDLINNGYYSSLATNVDFSVDSAWQNAVEYKDLNAAGSETGIISYYKIYRLCTLSNTPINGAVGSTQNECQTDSGTASVSSSDGSSTGYNTFNFSNGFTGTSVYFKIMVKTVGLKGSTIITETVVKVMADTA